MPETSSPSNDQNVLAAERAIKRLRTLTIVSLSLNGLILFLIILGAIIHHHRMERGFGGPGDGPRFQDRGPGGDDRRFHRFGSGGWGQRGGFDRGDRFGGGRPQEDGSRGGPDRGPGGPPPGMPGMGGERPDPAKMGERIMDHLSQKLSLTEDEKAKIKPIVDAQVADVQKQMEDQRAAMQKQVEDARAKIRPLLTADQQKQLDALPLPGQEMPGR
jgi:hypothetical protein